MINVQQPRTLRVGHRRRKKKTYKHGIVLFTLFWGILVGAGARAYFDNPTDESVSLVEYTQVAEPTIQDANRLAETYTALILQAQDDPTVMETEQWIDGTEATIKEMDRLIGTLRDTTTSDEATRLHRKNTIAAYAMYATAMEKIRNGMILQDDTLVSEGKDALQEADDIVTTMRTTVPYPRHQNEN